MFGLPVVACPWTLVLDRRPLVGEVQLLSDPGRETTERKIAEITSSSLPSDIDALHGFLLQVRKLLDERIGRIGDSYELEVASQHELAALVQLEEEISERVAELRVASVSGILSKFEIWDLLREMEDGGAESAARDRLIRSIRRDLEHLNRA